MDLELTGHTAVIAGGARGIGRAIAEAFAAKGAAVALFDLDPTVADTAGDIGERHRLAGEPPDGGTNRRKGAVIGGRLRMRGSTGRRTAG